MSDTDTSGTDQKETVTISVIANFEVDPDEFDLRYRRPETIRQQLCQAIIPGSVRIQETLETDDEALIERRNQIKEARSADTDTEQ